LKFWGEGTEELRKRQKSLKQNQGDVDSAPPVGKIKSGKK
jgi:hypothetical protein